MAVFLVVVGCSDGDDFQPARGATVEVEELEALIRAAVTPFDLEWKMAQPEPMPADDGRPSCFEVESGPCYVPPPPGLAVALHGDDGTDVIVRVGLGMDSLEAGDRVDGSATSRRFVQTRTLRVIYETPEQLAGFAGGPCDYRVDRKSDEGCAWRERDAPRAGNAARAMRSDTLENTGLSAAAFARQNVVADIEVVRRGNPDPPDKLADDLARALDEQIKLALSQ